MGNCRHSRLATHAHTACRHHLLLTVPWFNLLRPPSKGTIALKYLPCGRYLQWHADWQ
jgi:hypothetical protein